MSYSKIPKIGLSATDQQLTASAGLARTSSLASWLDLPCQLARRVRRMGLLRGFAGDRMLLSLIYTFCGIESLSP